LDFVATYGADFPGDARLTEMLPYSRIMNIPREWKPKAFSGIAFPFKQSVIAAV